MLREAGRRSSDHNLGDSAGIKMLTAYREGALRIAFLLSQNHSLSAKDLKKMGTDPEKTYRTLFMIMSTDGSNAPARACMP